MVAPTARCRVRVSVANRPRKKLYECLGLGKTATNPHPTLRVWSSFRVEKYLHAVSLSDSHT